jgi:hypothetical protein
MCFTAPEVLLPDSGAFFARAQSAGFPTLAKYARMVLMLFHLFILLNL